MCNIVEESATGLVQTATEEGQVHAINKSISADVNGIVNG